MSATVSESSGGGVVTDDTCSGDGDGATVSVVVAVCSVAVAPLAVGEGPGIAGSDLHELRSTTKRSGSRIQHFISKSSCTDLLASKGVFQVSRNGLVRSPPGRWCPIASR